MFRPMTKMVHLQRFARRTRPFNPPSRVPVGLIGPPAGSGTWYVFCGGLGGAVGEAARVSSYRSVV